MQPPPPETARLHRASAAGWAGLTIVEAPHGVTLVASLARDVLDHRRSLWLGAAVQPSERPRLLRLRLRAPAGSEPWVAEGLPGCAGVDLAYPRGRAMICRASRRGAVWIVFLEAGTGEVAAVEEVPIDGIAGFLEDAVARAAEWHPEALAPPEVAASAWAAALERAPCLAPSAEDCSAIVVVPQATLDGLEDDRAMLTITRPRDDVRWDRLRLDIAGEGQGRSALLDLRLPCQRHLAWRLSHQSEIVVLGADTDAGGAATARLIVPIDAPARVLLRRAGRGR